MSYRMEMKVVVVLALLLWGISHEVDGGRATSISEQEDLELERELRGRLNKPTIKSFQECCTFFSTNFTCSIFCVLIWTIIVL